ncbi:hypothetical protein [Streptomyces sp. Je 1-369]|nr:hypothetical protein [Streptomyces sp. Je 1-369]WAL98639.1 hypothetical protein NOO62_31645 [Streptomyces sp. Je 1-369]
MRIPVSTLARAAARAPRAVGEGRSGPRVRPALPVEAAVLSSEGVVCVPR